jgi:hypothetical protein
MKFDSKHWTFQIPDGYRADQKRNFIELLKGDSDTPTFKVRLVHQQLEKVNPQAIKAFRDNIKREQPIEIETKISIFSGHFLRSEDHTKGTYVLTYQNKAIFIEIEDLTPQTQSIAEALIDTFTEKESIQSR